MQGSERKTNPVAVVFSCKGYKTLGLVRNFQLPIGIIVSFLSLRGP